VYSPSCQILVVCGARKGFRYSSHDIVRLRSIAESLDAYYAAVDEAFRALPSDVIRFRFPEATRRLEDDAPNFERLRAHRKNGLCTPEERLEPQDTVRRQAFQFQWLARQYVVAFARLRNAVMEIRLRLLSSTKTPPTVPTLSDLNDPGRSRGFARCDRGGVTWIDWSVCDGRAPAGLPRSRSRV
jgi:hypothetical protein